MIILPLCEEDLREKKEASSLARRKLYKTRRKDNGIWPEEGQYIHIFTS
jgi:hypothetical protein